MLAVATAIVLQRSTFGLRLRAIGLNELAARRAGMPGGIMLVVALAVAGAFGGLAGAIMLQGEQYYLKTGFSSGYGFDGLVVGLLSRGSTLGVLAGRCSSASCAPAASRWRSWPACRRRSPSSSRA